MNLRQNNKIALGSGMSHMVKIEFLIFPKEIYSYSHAI